MALGRGLDALLSDNKRAHENREAQEAAETAASQAAGQVEEIPSSQLRASVYQPRKRFNDEGIAELAESIKENGLLEPLLVKKSDDGGYEIICGERRFRACKLAGIAKIPCLVKSMLPKESYAAALIENIQREDLNPLEQASALEQMMNECGMTQDELAKSLGKPRSGITNLLRLNSLEQGVKDLISEGKLGFGHAKVIMGLEKELQLKAAEYVVKRDLSVRQTEEFVGKIKGQKGGTQPAPKKENPDLEAIEKSFADKYSDLRFSIQGRSRKRGKIVLGYASEEEFNRIMDILDIKA